MASDPGQFLGLAQVPPVAQDVDHFLEGGDHVEDLGLAQGQARAEATERNGIGVVVGGHAAIDGERPVGGKGTPQAPEYRR